MKSIPQLILLSMFFTLSCKSHRDTTNSYHNANIDISFQLSIIDAVGNDLLNPNFGHSFGHSKITHYKLDENKTEIELMLKNNFIITPSKIESKYFINITELGSKQLNNTYLSYLKLSDKITDTIKVKTIENKGSIFKDKIWYNNNLVWDSVRFNNLPIVITK